MACLDLEALGRQLARLGRGIGGQIQDAVAFLDVEAGDGDQRAGSRLPFDADLILRAGHRAIRRDGSAAGGLDVTRHRQEAFGIAEEGRETRADFADDARAERGCVVLLTRRAGDTVAPRAQHERDAVVEADLVLDVDAQLLYRFIGEGAGRIVGQQCVIVDVVEIDQLRTAVIAFTDLVPAIVDAHQQLMFDIRAGVEVDLQIIVGGKDVHPRVAGIGGQADGASVCTIDRKGVERVGIAVGIVGEIFKVAVDIASLQA